jgi:predicted transposase YbfD/YdcC
MPASPSLLISALSCAPPGITVPDTASGLPAALARLPDPRARRGVRHRLPVVLSAAVCAVVAGYRSYTAIAEWVDDVPATIALTLGIDPDRRPSETMIRRLLQALDPDLLTAAISEWLTTRATTAPAGKRAIAVDGKTLRGSRTADTTAQHVLAACDQDTGVVLASTDVDGKTNEITRFAPLLDHIGDLHDTLVTVDALHCQRDHVTYLAERGADWILTVKANQPTLHAQLAALPWRAVPDATRDTDRGHGRREIRTLKILTVSTGIGFPHAAQALQIRRRRHRLDQPKRFTTETVYAITNCACTRPDRRSLPHGSAGTGTSRTNCTGFATSPTTRTDPRSAPAPALKSWPPCATPPSARSASPESPTSPPPTATTPGTRTGHWHYSASPDDFAGALHLLGVGTGREEEIPQPDHLIREVRGYLAGGQSFRIQ